MKKDKRLFIKDIGANGLECKTDSLSLLLDIKALLKDYYVATFTANEKELEIKFDNGQKFLISAEEIK